MSARTIIEILAGVFLSILLWNSTRDHPAPVGQYVAPQKAPELKIIPTEQLTCKPITVYVPIAKTEVDLPAEVAQDTNKFVLDANTIKSDRHPQELVTVYDDKSGKVTSLIREKDYPWLQALQTGYIGVGYDFNHSEYTAFVHEDLLAIKALRFGVDASAARSSISYGISGAWGW